MARRIYYKTVAKISAVIGIPAMIGIFAYLSSIGVIQVTGYSGDSICSGTLSDPCYAYINFTANEDIFIYPDQSWVFYTNPTVKEIRMYRKWGTGWREYDLTTNCKGTWCGAPNSKTNTSYSVAFRKGSKYELRFVALKFNPADIVKWGFTEQVDPVWYGPSNADANATVYLDGQFADRDYELGSIVTIFANLTNATSGALMRDAWLCVNINQTGMTPVCVFNGSISYNWTSYAARSQFSDNSTSKTVNGNSSVSFLIHRFDDFNNGTFNITAYDGNIVNLQIGFVNTSNYYQFIGVMKNNTVTQNQTNENGTIHTITYNSLGQTILNFNVSSSQNTRISSLSFNFTGSLAGENLEVSQGTGSFADGLNNASQAFFTTNITADAVAGFYVSKVCIYVQKGDGTWRYQFGFGDSHGSTVNPTYVYGPWPLNTSASGLVCSNTTVTNIVEYNKIFLNFNATVTGTQGGEDKILYTLNNASYTGCNPSETSCGARYVRGPSSPTPNAINGDYRFQIYAQTYPTNISILINGTTINYNRTGPLNKSIMAYVNVTNHTTFCSSGTNQICRVPVYIRSSTAGRIVITDMQLNYTVNPIVIPPDLVNKWLLTQPKTGLNVSINITTRRTGDNFTISGLNYYYNGTDNVTIIAYSNITTNTSYGFQNNILYTLALWRMDEANGLVAIDNTSYGRNLTLGGAGWVNGTDCALNTTSCLNYSRINTVSYIAPNSINFTNSSGIGFDGFVKIPNVNRQMTILQYYRVTESYARLVQIQTLANGTLKCNLRTDIMGESEPIFSTEGKNITDNQWHRITCTRSVGTISGASGNWLMFIDNVLQDNQTGANINYSLGHTPVSDGNKMWLNFSFDDNSYLNGSIDEWRITNSTIYPSESDYAPITGFTVRNSSVYTNLYYSKFNFSFPNNTRFLEFIPQSPTSVNVSPFSQTPVIPILNITPLNHDRPANFTITINDTLACFNVTAYSSHDTTNAITLRNGTWTDLPNYRNLNMTNSTGLWLYGQYNCSLSSWQLFVPNILLRGCCINCLCSSAVR